MNNVTKSRLFAIAAMMSVILPIAWSINRSRERAIERAMLVPRSDGIVTLDKSKFEELTVWANTGKVWKEAEDRSMAQYREATNIQAQLSEMVDKANSILKEFRKREKEFDERRMNADTFPVTLWLGDFNGANTNRYSVSFDGFTIRIDHLTNELGMAKMTDWIWMKEAMR